MSVTPGRKTTITAAAVVAALTVIVGPAHARTDRGAAPSMPEVSATVETPPSSTTRRAATRTRTTRRSGATRTTPTAAW